VLKTSREILQLRVCDPTVGSGAIIVAACRYLADRLVEAWQVEVADGRSPTRLEGVQPDEWTLEARRLVVDHCLYGVDRDPMAVQMTKLSLWLTTMAKERPFTFLDHAFRSGDSLLGVTALDQIAAFHLDPVTGRINWALHPWVQWPFFWRPIHLIHFSVINTLYGMAININTWKPILANGTGGLSGPAVKPIALSMVWKVAGCVGIPVIGCGGIMNAEDALEFIMAGATAVEVGTANLVNPRTALDIIDGLYQFMKAEGIGNIAELRGAARL
jgi:hypothetical protein